MHPTEPVIDFRYEAEIIRWKDADTVVLDIDQGFDGHTHQTIRPARCDTPEANKHPELPAGRWVTERVREWTGSTRECKIHSLEWNPDSFRRSVCEMWVRGENFSSWLLTNQLAWPTDENGKLETPRNIDLLLGIPADIRELVRSHPDYDPLGVR